MKTLPIAIIGTGWITQHGYLPHLIQRKGVQVAAAYDTSKTSLDKTARSLGLDERNLSLEACLAPRITAVLLCTPPHVHCSEIAQCISYGKYVLCEKPVCRNISEIAEAGPAATLQAKLMGSAAMRLRQDIDLLLTWVKQGLLGDLRSVRLAWWREKGVPAAGSWRTDSILSPLGVMEDLGPHLLDIVAALSSALKWKSVHLVSANLQCKYGDSARTADWFEKGSAAHYQVPDQSQALFSSDSGTEIHVETCWASDLPGDWCSIRLTGSRGEATFEGLLGFSTSRRSPAQFCSLEVAGQPAQIRHFRPGPEIQQQAFARSIATFADFCENKAAPVAGYSEIRQVAEWLTQIKEIAEAPANKKAGVLPGATTSCVSIGAPCE